MLGNRHGFFAFWQEKMPLLPTFDTGEGEIWEQA